jgi:hypothetical protein
MISNEIISHAFGLLKILYEIPSKFYPNVSDNLIIKNEVI